MKAFLSLAVLAAFVFAVSGCKNKPCSQIKPYVDTVASGLGHALDCKNILAMQVDMMNWVEKKGYCTPVLPTGPIASIVCPIAINYLVSFGVGKLPTTWECSGEPVATALSVACQAIPL